MNRLSICPTWKVLKATNVAVQICQPAAAQPWLHLGSAGVAVFVGRARYLCSPELSRPMCGNLPRSPLKSRHPASFRLPFSRPVDKLALALWVGAKVHAASRVTVLPKGQQKSSVLPSFPGHLAAIHAVLLRSPVLRAISLARVPNPGFEHPL